MGLELVGGAGIEEGEVDAKRDRKIYRRLISYNIFKKERQTNIGRELTVTLKR